jgi:hypothetical protein
MTTPPETAASTAAPTAASRCRVHPSPEPVRGDAAAVVINLTVIGADRTVFVSVYPCTSNLPVAASLNYTSGVNRGNELIAQLSDSGELCLFTSGTTHFTVDIVGYVSPMS